LALLLAAALMKISVAFAQLPPGPLAIVPPASGAYVGPLDQVSTSVVACYSLRGCSAALAIAGNTKSIDIRRASDSQTCAVLIATTGGLGNTTGCSGSGSGTPIATFCSGVDACNVTGIYDQTGSCPEITQSTSGDQGDLGFSLLGSKPAIRLGFANYGEYQTSSFCSTASQPYTLSVVWEPTTTGTTEAWLVSFSSSFNGLGMDQAVPEFVMQAGGTAQNIAYTAGTLYSIQAVFNAGSSTINLNGALTSLAASPGSGGLNANFAVGAGYGFNYPSTGYLAEVIVYGSALTAGSGNQQCKLEISAKNFWPITVTGC
jgi:hypothetical protein